MVVEPLFYQDRQLGIMVMEYVQGDERLFEFMQMQISNALDRLLIGQEIRESEQRYHALMDNLRELIIVHRDGNLLFANRAARQYLDNASQGRSLLDILMQEAPQRLEQERSSPTEGGDYEIDVLDGMGIERRMIVRAQEVYYNLAPAEQIILIDITERKRMENYLYYMSTRDVLTGLYNRAFFEERLAQLETGPRPVCLVVVDVDDLKRVNDQQGHPAGDELLRLAARALRGAFRGEDTIARIGGDEFAVLLPQMAEEGLIKSIERMRRILDEIQHAQPEFPLSLSIGGAAANEGEPLVEVFKRADQAMYREKAEKKASRE
jgi:diguanylate cyclase (GGDEF)-like protein/PAS domain S-box-containing protein